jgi:hypothetical protein
MTTVANLEAQTAALAAINANFDAIEAAFDEVLFRDGDGAATDNAMVDDLDMNSQMIINLPAPTTDTEPARHGDLQTYVDDAETAQAAAEAAVTDAEAAVTAAQTAQTAAELAETNAETAETAAEAAQAATEALLESVSPWSTVKSEANSFILALTDASKWIRTTSGSSMNVTVPPQTDIAWADNTEIHIEQAGAGQVTIVAGSGVTVNTPETLVFAKQYAVATLKRVALNTWTLVGYLAAAE